MHAGAFSYIIGRDDPAAPLHDLLARISAFAPHVIPPLIPAGAALTHCLERLHEDARR
jgi:hypothetical protein